MKKLFIILSAILISLSIVGCKKETTSETPKEGYVSAEAAVKAGKDENIHVLDIRTWDNYSEGRIEGSEWQPIFPLENEALVDEMKAYAEAHLKDGKDIYLVCNSGQKGAVKATEVLIEAGVPKEKIFTVEGGAKALKEINGALTTKRYEENIDWKYVSGKEAVEKLGSSDVQFLDVRDDDTFNEGHLKGSLQVNLKDVESKEAQDNMFKLANEQLSKDKPIYILCYSGNKCAKTAISVLKDAGYNTDNLFIIENGAKDDDIKNNLGK